MREQTRVDFVAIFLFRDTYAIVRDNTIFVYNSIRDLSRSYNSSGLTNWKKFVGYEDKTNCRKKKHISTANKKYSNSFAKQYYI